MRQYKGISPGSLPPTNAPDFTQRLRNMLASIDNYLHDTGKGFSRIDVGLVPQGSGAAIPFRASSVSSNTGNLTMTGSLTTNGIYSTGAIIISGAGLTTDAFTMLTGAGLGKLLTSSSLGVGTWQTLDLSAYAPLASPTFTGTPAAPTAAFGTSTTQLATTAFVQGAAQAMFALTTSDTCNNTATETDISNAGGSGSAALGAQVAGAVVRVTAGGTMTVAGIGETLLFRIKHGTTVIADCGSYLPGLAGSPLTNWTLDATITWRSATSVVVTGTVTFIELATPYGQAIPLTQAATTVSSTGTLGLFAKWSLANVSNTCTCLTCVFEQIR